MALDIFNVENLVFFIIHLQTILSGHSNEENIFVCGKTSKNLKVCRFLYFSCVYSLYWIQSLVMLSRGRRQLWSNLILPRVTYNKWWPEKLKMFLVWTGDTNRNILGLFTLAWLGARLGFQAEPLVWTSCSSDQNCQTCTQNPSWTLFTLKAQLRLGSGFSKLSHEPSQREMPHCDVPGSPCLSKKRIRCTVRFFLNFFIGNYG